MKALIITLSVIGIVCTIYGIYLVKQPSLELKPQAGKAESFLPFAPEYVLNCENVYREIMRNDIKFSDIVLRQVILETGWFKSHNCLVRQNLVGMTGGIKNDSNEHGYAIYSNWMQSIKAYSKWQKQRLNDSVTNYFQFLRDWNYAESPDYERKLKSINLVIVKQ